MMKSKDLPFKWDGCPCVKDVAEAYFPQYAYSRTTVAALRRKIATTSALMEEMLREEYNPQEKHFTPKQMIVLAKHLGKPGDLRVFLHEIDPEYF